MFNWLTTYLKRSKVILDADEEEDCPLCDMGAGAGKTPEELVAEMEGMSGIHPAIQGSSPGRMQVESTTASALTERGYGPQPCPWPEVAPPPRLD